MAQHLKRERRKTIPNSGQLIFLIQMFVTTVQAPKRFVTGIKRAIIRTEHSLSSQGQKIDGQHFKGSVFLANELNRCPEHSKSAVTCG